MPDNGQRFILPERMRMLIPLAVFVIALAIRLVGIGWGLKNDLHNQSYHPDEEDIFRYSQGVEPAHLKFTPGVYNYGTFYLTTLRVASDMTAAYTGSPDLKSADSTWSYIARCNLAGRIISALAGAGTVLVVFLIGLRLTNLLGGLGAAAILAVSPAHIVHSRFQTVDVMAVFLLAASAFYALRLIPKDGVPSPSEKQILKWVVASGAFAGLSGGTKYTGILGVLMVLVVLFAHRKSTFARDGLIAVAATIGAFVLSCPGVLLDNEAFMRDFKYEMLHTSRGHGLVFEGTANGFLYHLLNLFQGIGAFATMIGIGALGYAAYRKQIWAIALLAFMLPYYVLIGRAEVKFLRYTFPLYVGLSVGFGWAISKGQEHKKLGRYVVGAGILAIGGLDGSGLVGAARFTGYMTAEDPRDAAARYLKEQAKTNPAMVVGLPEDPWFWSPPLFKDSTIARRSMSPLQRDEAMRAATAPAEIYYKTPEGNPTQFDRRLITEIKPEFVAYSSFEYSDPERFQGRTDVSSDALGLAAQYKEFVEALKHGYNPDQSFGDDVTFVQDLAYVQPHVRVWKLKTTH